MEQYSIRAYKPEDGLKISTLFTKYVTYLRDDKFWVWINRFFTQESIVAVAECDEKIIGHYAVLPQTIKIDGKDYSAGLGIHAFIAPEYASNFSIFQISSFAYQLAKDQGLDFVYGFPNKNYRLIQEKIERWKKVSLFNALELPKENLICENNSEYAIEQIDFSDFSDFYMLNDILEKKEYKRVEIGQSVSNWNNRYILHPQKPYVFFRLYYQKNVCGYFVGKFYRNNNTNYFHVVDFATYGYVTMKDALSVLFSHQKKNFDVISCWKGNDETNKAFNEMGFLETGFDTFLGVKILNKEVGKIISDTLLDFDNWRLVMGNSDAF